MGKASDLGVNLQDIMAARRRIAPYVVRTPTVLAKALKDRVGADIALKLDSLQHTGSFKLRGATNRMLRLSPAEREAGVVACSTGNHGRAVAEAARRLGIPAKITLSELVPENKLAGIRAHGAETIVHGKSQDEAFEEAHRLVREEGMTLIDTFDHPDVIAGQGTAGLELLEDMPDIDTLLVPLSGGGLMAGMAVAAKAANPDIRVVGISMERGPAMIESLRAGKPVQVEEKSSLADSLGGGIGLDNRWSFPLVRALGDDFILLSEDEIAAGMTHLYWYEQLVAEGASAVGVGALLSGKVKPRGGGTVATVVSGCNVDMATFTRVVTGDAY
jgi:threonine dehydratase